MTSLGCQVLIFLGLLSSIVPSHQRLIEAASEFSSRTYPIHGASINGGSNGGSSEFNGTRWAILVAGSNGWENYRHQADVCHAYQMLKKGGLKEENIVVFMFDDIAFDTYNPRPGILINRPDGYDVYDGVPKDYTGKHCNVDNLFAVIMGDKSALTGGSGKVINSGPDDYIFIYYADHGAPGLVEMPSGDMLYANDLIEVLKMKHAANSYKSMVIYLEACESGSMFDGLLPNNLNIYAVTASNPNESSWGFYCPGDFPSPPQEYEVCLGDLFSIAWMEDSDIHDLQKETLDKQYQVVKRRTGDDNLDQGSHVMRYGDMKMGKEFVSVYMGRNPENDNYTLSRYTTQTTTPSTPRVVKQRDADLVFYRNKYEKAPEGSPEKYEAYKKLRQVLSHRNHVDETMNHIARQLFGEELGIGVQNVVRPAGQPLVDDWDCLKNMVKTYEKQCGPLLVYGRKYTRAFANMCNAGVTVEKMNVAAKEACFARTPSSAS